MSATGQASQRRKRPYTRDSIARALAHHESTGAIYLASPPMAMGPRKSDRDLKWHVKLTMLEDPLVLSNGEAYLLCVGLAAGERRWKP